MTGAMARSVEGENRRMLRARTPWTATSRSRSTWPRLAAVAHVSEAHFIRIVQGDLRRDAAPLPAAPARRAGDVPAARRPSAASPTSAWRSGSPVSAPSAGRSRDIVGESPSAFRRSGPDARGADVLRQGVDATEQFRRSVADDRPRTVVRMYNAITRSQIFVLDQDEALDFYVDKLGLEVNTDQDLGFMRWLTVRVPGDPVREILLERPGPPAMDEATAAQVRELVTKGAMGGWLVLHHRRRPEDLRDAAGRGVEFTDEPSPSAVRHRLRHPRPVRQRHPHRPDVRRKGEGLSGPGQRGRRFSGKAAMPSAASGPPNSSSRQRPHLLERRRRGRASGRRAAAAWSSATARGAPGTIPSHSVGDGRRRRRR